MSIYIRLMLLILWMILIFSLSHESSSGSLARSEAFVGAIQTFNLGSDALESMQTVRKGAHVALYVVLGLLATWLFAAFFHRARIYTPVALMFGVMYAVTDEYHQTFIPGRSGELRDVIIDGCAVLVGVCLAAVIAKVAGRLRR